MKKNILFATLLMLASCASVQTTQIEHDGKQAYKLTCSEFNSSLSECKANADKLCTNGYQLLDHHQEIHADSGDGFYMPTTHYLTIQCS
ncbi:MAG: hypothetical protein Q8S46_00525 [Methylotenera sp.]|nr:hypothetical protein [Methylotenera sp.]MDO9232710.1 hypothetical protein [Methylotenera sp.]MDO9389843.1 hypothetical protein [Methylotenera sp.]MDP1596340.1 hypothetical protein [Methylotenera sp.]MDP1755779.1 hypothetical protein [Methylotenera sp.]